MASDKRQRAVNWCEWCDVRTANYQTPESGDLQNNTNTGCLPDFFSSTQRKKKKGGLAMPDYVLPLNNEINILKKHVNIMDMCEWQ